MLCIIDEYTRESLAIRVARRLKATDVIETSAICSCRAAFPHTFAQTMARSSSPCFREWIAAVGAKTAYIEPEARGRMASAKASTESCATSC